MSRISLVLSGAALALGVSLVPVAVRAEGPTAAQIMDKVENRSYGRDQISKVTLEIHPKEGTSRLRQFVSMRKEFDKVTKLATFFLAPTDVRGAAFLVFDRKGADDLRWLYLPAIGQVRQLSAESNRQSFFGSDFVYEDLTNRDPDQDEHKMVGSQKVDEWDCWVIDSTPKNARGLDFAHYKSWVWKTADLIVRQEYYDGDGKVVRRGVVKAVQNVQDIWTWRQGTMENLRTGSSTKIEISDVKYNTDVPDERFAESQLNRGAPKL
jgi:outer membrane lipoprotein-sorting protein